VFEHGILAMNPIRLRNSYPLSVISSGQRAIDSLLCVAYDNVESKGRFYLDPGTLGSTAFAEPSGEKDYSYSNALTSATSDDAIYDSGKGGPRK